MTIEKLEDILNIEDARNLNYLSDLFILFYRQKAKYLKTIAEKLTSPPYNGSVPSTLDELVCVQIASFMLKYIGDALKTQINH